MTDEAQGRQRRRSKLWIAALALTIFVALIVIPPLVSINRYKTSIARAISASVGRPVHLSGVELRLFPRPGFVITNLTIEEDPAYGAEPVLHANEVTAAIRLFSLWRGRLEISRISVDEASLNLVRTTDGRWNLDTLFRTAAQTQPGEVRSRKIPLPYLEATNSRINVKRGNEKLPYSLVNADLSFWEENPGDWRLRLKGQPARTDMELQLGDTGVVQLEGRMLRAPELRLMPVHVEMEWREAQLGQLSRLLIGSDPGWRGDLTAEMKLDGTAGSAQVTTRLRATGVHRAEFAPAVPLDFDANCGFAYQYSIRTINNLVCGSPLGDGRLRLEGNLPSDGQPKVSLELQRIPAQAILDALRTVRSELGAGLEADGSLSGKLTYDSTPPVQAAQLSVAAERRNRKTSVTKLAPATPGPLAGSITLEGLKLSGGSLSQPIQIQKVVLEPAARTDGQGEFLSGTASLPAGAPAALVFTAHLTLNGYEITARGNGSPSRLRQLARAAGLKEAGALDAISGDPATVDLSIAGRWLPAPDESLVETVAEIPSNDLPPSQPVPDRLTGTVTLHNASWKTDALRSTVDIPQATLHLNGGTIDWDPVAFSYGPLSGLAHVQIPAGCVDSGHCIPRVNLDFPTLDAAELQAALLGSEQKGTLLSTVIARLTPSSTHSWPAFQGTVKAGSLVLGPVTLQSFAADIKVNPAVVDFNAIDAGLLGGQIHLSGQIENGDQPSYTLEGTFQNLNPAELCRILALRCSGNGFDGDGKIKLTGFEGKDLAGSAKGAIHFVWKKGTVPGRTTSPDATPPVPPMLARFDQWTADAEIAGGVVTLKDNQVRQGKRTSGVKGSITFADPPKVTFVPAKSETRPEAVSKK
ncbi:MAG TPA: AsmA family protein [Terracidiphilus sp.]|jgi:hypothetical protein